MTGSSAISFCFGITSSSRVYVYAKFINLCATSARFTALGVPSTTTIKRRLSTSLYDQATPIDLNSFDLLTQRIHLLDTNQQIKTIEPLETTKTHVNIKLNQQHLTAPLTQVMNLATVTVYQNNQLIRSLQIENNVEIEEANIFQKIMIWFANLFSFFSTNDVKAAKIYPLNQG